jgi:hypothetical protein
MSSWGKFLAPVTASTGGWAFVWSTSDVRFTATIPAGSYDTYMHMMSTLGDQIDTQLTDHAATGKIWVTSTAITNFNVTEFKAIIWASSNTALLSTMGFDQNETATSTVIATNEIHAYAWYPGLLSLPPSGGVGLEDDTGSEPEDTSVRTIAGSGKSRGVGPARDTYTRTMRFSAIRRTEYEAKNRGPRNFLDRWKNKQIWWYPDRSVGLVSSYSTQVDPGYPYYDVDDDGGYFKLFISRVQFTRATSTPRWQTVTMTANVEPK